MYHHAQLPVTVIAALLLMAGRLQHDGWKLPEESLGYPRVKLEGQPLHATSGCFCSEDSDTLALPVLGLSWAVLLLLTSVLTVCIHQKGILLLFFLILCICVCIYVCMRTPPHVCAGAHRGRNGNGGWL